MASLTQAFPLRISQNINGSNIVNPTTILSAGPPGTATMAFGLRGQRGRSWFPQTIIVTSNHARIEVARSGFARSEVQSIPAGEDVEVSVVVTGGARMYRYTCRWSLEGGTGSSGLELSSQQSTFRKVGDNQWVSKITVRYPYSVVDDLRGGGYFTTKRITRHD